VDSAAVDMPDDVSVERSDAIKPSIRCVVIDCSSIMFIDTVGTTTIQQVLTLTPICRIDHFEWDRNYFIKISGYHFIVFVG